MCFIPDFVTIGIKINSPLVFVIVAQPSCVDIPLLPVPDITVTCELLKSKPALFAEP